MDSQTDHQWQNVTSSGGITSNSRTPKFFPPIPDTWAV